MTTNACLITLGGPNWATGFSTTATDDTYTESTDNVSSLSLYKVAKGKQISWFIGSYTAGSGLIRVRNTQTNQVRMLEALTMPKGMKVTYLEKPFVVQENDILEIYTTAAGT